MSSYVLNKTLSHHKSLLLKIWQAGHSLISCCRRVLVMCKKLSSFYCSRCCTLFLKLRSRSCCCDAAPGGSFKKGPCVSTWVRPDCENWSILGCTEASRLTVVVASAEAALAPQSLATPRVWPWKCAAVIAKLLRFSAQQQRLLYGSTGQLQQPSCRCGPIPIPTTTTTPCLAPSFRSPTEERPP